MYQRYVVTNCGVISQVDFHTLIGGPYEFDPNALTACNAKTWRLDGTC